MNDEQRTQARIQASADVRAQMVAEQERARAIIDDNTKVLEAFVLHYCLDTGFGVQMLEAIIRGLSTAHVANGTSMSEASVNTAKDMLSGAVTDVINLGGLLTTPSYDLERVIDGALSLEFLVRHARQLPDGLVPPEVIPSEEVVQACLTIFHRRKIDRMDLTGNDAVES